MAPLELTLSLSVLLISFAVQTAFFAGLLWCAVKLLRQKANWFALVTAAAISALLGLIPLVGPLVGFIALILLINRFTGLGRFNSILAVIIAWGLGFAATIGILTLVDAVSVNL